MTSDTHDRLRKKQNWCPSETSLCKRATEILTVADKDPAGIMETCDWCISVHILLSPPRSGRQDVKKKKKKTSLRAAAPYTVMITITLQCLGLDVSRERWVFSVRCLDAMHCVEPQRL